MSYWKETSLVDDYGFGVENTPMDEQRVVTPYRIVGSTFGGSVIDSNFWVTGGSVAGTVTTSGAQISLDTTAGGANSSTTLQSFRTARYVAGSANRFRTILQLGDVGEALNVRRWGAFTTGDGCFFQLSGTSIGVATRRAGTDVVVGSGSWNGTVSALPTLTNASPWEIYWTNSKLYFAAGGALLHSITASTTPWTDRVTLPIRMESVNRDGLNTSHTVVARVASIHRLGAATTLPTSKYVSGQTTGTVCKIGQGNLHRVVIGGVANGSIVALYDSPSAAANTIWSSGAMPNATNPFSIDFGGLPFFNGLYLVISAQNANVTVIYE
jgi:hypothetical protein